MVVAHDVPSCKSVICNYSCKQENIKLWGIYEVYPQLLNTDNVIITSSLLAIKTPCLTLALISTKVFDGETPPLLSLDTFDECWIVDDILFLGWRPQLEQSLVFWQVCSPRHAVHRLLKLPLGWLAVSEFGWKTDRSTVMKLVEVSFSSVIANIGVSRSTYTAKTLLFGPSESCSICRWGSNLRPESPLPNSSSLVARIHQ